LVISTVATTTLALRVAIILLIAIVPILRLCCRTRCDEYSENECKARYRPTNPCSEIVFHIELFSLSPR
jgi:hypothetical protein